MTILVLLSFLVFSIFITKDFIYNSTSTIENAPYNGLSSAINGNIYDMDYISEEFIEKTKSQIDNIQFSEGNTMYDGLGTGIVAPTQNEIESLMGKKIIKNINTQFSTPQPGAIYDISSQMYFPIVSSQGSQGSCSAWATTYYAYGYLEAKDNNWDASSGNYNYLLNPGWTFNKVSATDYGSWQSSNAQILKDFGCATYNTMPYDHLDYYSWGNEAAWREAPLHKINNYYLLDFNEANPSLTINTLKTLIGSDTPVTFTFHADGYTPGFADGNYILSSSEYDSPDLNHAQCIVGFDDSVTDDGDVGAFKVVNSWGSFWGDNGFYWLTYDCLIEIGYALGDYALQLCVITDEIDYQPELVATWEFDVAPMRMDDIFTIGVGPHGSELTSYTPTYEYDDSYQLPNFMAFDISNYMSYYNANNDVLFFLDIGPSSISGIISSFLIERYESGALIETTAESINVPKETPGYVVNSFMTIDHEIWVEMNSPQYPQYSSSYLINATMQNLGLNAEADVELNIYINDVLVNQTLIPLLSIGNIVDCSYLWTPMEYGKYNITAESPLLMTDCIPSSNKIESIVWTYDVTNYTMIDDYFYSWKEASGGEELLLGDDDFHQTKLPFEFSYYDGTFLDVYVSSNGYLSFNDTSPYEWQNFNFPLDEPAYQYMIAPFWDDIYPQLGGNIYIRNFSDCWVAEWKDVKYSDADQNIFDTCSFQVVLYETGDIIFNYEYFNIPIQTFDYTTGLNLGKDPHYYTYIDTLDGSETEYSIFFPNQNPPEPFSLSSDAGSPDNDGNFTLSWGASNFAVSYSVYQFSSPITEINGSLTTLASGIPDLIFDIADYSDGSYYFVVEAQNVNGETLSNCLKVVISIPPSTFKLSSDADSPDEDGDFTLSWSASNFATNYSVYQFSGLITEINGSLTILATEITDLTFNISDYSDGSYYFIVVAKNMNGETLSNSIKIEVDIYSIPGYSTFFIILSMFGFIMIYSKKIKKKNDFL
ncbi:C1 family peptidase [Promethearchaeum syntrophicum]|uniref:C1 family peptidase n=1 Tax=Promethearchaeum syntrophicum TaxID=2594042 RepID=A0A5B9DC89_9ARCH|nr:C1 family peptidase [Candidatus Prometheoarchaeum syntrophicum]